MHIGSISKKQYTNMFQLLELYIYCSMNEQSIEGVQKSKRLTS